MIGQDFKFLDIIKVKASRFVRLEVSAPKISNFMQELAIAQIS
jgi:hypothetical protein